MRTDTTTKGVAVPSEPESSASANIADRYLAQMIRTLARFDGVDDFVPAGPRPPASPLKRLVTRTLISFLRSRGLEVMRRIPFDATARSLGRDWPIHADTMIGIKRLENIRDLVKAIIAERVPGDLVETGVWRGGGSIMMRAALETYGDADARCGVRIRSRASRRRTFNVTHKTLGRLGTLSPFSRFPSKL